MIHLPDDPTLFAASAADAVRPYVDDLLARELTAASVDRYLRDWTALADRMEETDARLRIAVARDALDDDAFRRRHRFQQEVLPFWESASHRLATKLLTSGISLDGMDLPIRGIESDIALFREANLSLRTRERELQADYDRLVASAMIMREGRVAPLREVEIISGLDPRRRARERAWKAMMERRESSRQSIGEIWSELVELRHAQAVNAGFSDYRDYRWQQLHRFDYTPEAAERWHHAVEEWVTPIFVWRYEQRRESLRARSLRPWDLDVRSGQGPEGPSVPSPLDIVSLAETLLGRIEPSLAMFLHGLHSKQLLDLQRRPGKARGHLTIALPVSLRIAILLDATESERDAFDLLRECGRATQMEAASRWSYRQQRVPPAEFAEAAAGAVELMAAGHLLTEGYAASQEDRARVLAWHLERCLLRFPRAAMLDAFEHWIYLHPDEARDLDRCGDEWRRQWLRFLPAVDWTGLEAEQETGWQWSEALFRAPFTSLAVAIGQLGANQLWETYRDDPETALAEYRHAIGLGGTRPLPELFAAAGGHFSLDKHTLREAVAVVEAAINRSESGMA